MKVFLSSTYNDLIEHRIIRAGGKAAQGAKPRRGQSRAGGKAAHPHVRTTMNRRATHTKSALRTSRLQSAS
jgi:hypothetical protein